MSELDDIVPVSLRTKQLKEEILRDLHDYAMLKGLDEQIPAFLHILERMILLYERIHRPKLYTSIVNKITEKGIVDKLDPAQRMRLYALYERVRINVGET
jgi:hypothetical protein